MVLATPLVARIGARIREYETYATSGCWGLAAMAVARPWKPGKEDRLHVMPPSADTKILPAAVA
jgi:hypothetical protein